ncbi:hypothetical protein LOD99_13474 [Oopsacas minuta]|uniref:Major facilitator superfamily (MFS) profile domain-containing protein n=1 Tax=Oopsacas minuta TaxID=111878 RepID=A0AAV7KRI8_9METZ|nr:hypothetical protein LOD99_13474 [Oopsacas minuta]
MLPSLPSNLVVVIYILIFNYSFCFFMQTSVLPYLVKELGLDAVGYAYIQTLFNIIQFLGTPIYGRFGDIYGAKKALLLAFVSTILTYFFLAITDSVHFIVISRLCAMFMSTMQGCQMVLADVSDAKSRAGALGKLSAFYTLGLIMGSLSAGYLITLFSTQFTAWIATLGSISVIPLILYFIPTSVKSDNAHLTSAKNTSLFDLSPWRHVLSIPGVIPIFMICLLSGVPGMIWSSLLPIFSIDLFELEPHQYGWLMTYLAVIRFIILTFGVSYFTSRFLEFNIILGSVLLKLVSYLLIGIYPSLIWYCLISIPLSMADALFGAVSTTMLTNIVPESSTGLALGLNYIGIGFVGMITPIVGGYLYSYLGYCLFACSVALLEVIALAYISSLGYSSTTTYES